MKRIKITSNHSSWPIIRQTPNSKGVWNDCQFLIDDDTKDCDWWIVFDGLIKPETAACKKENTILITAEPPSIKTYDQDFVDQFGTVVSCHRKMKHPNVIFDQQSLPWMIGSRFTMNKKEYPTEFSKDYNELKSMSVMNTKTKLISVISSNKTNTLGHKNRLEFVQKLKKHFGDRIDIFGRGLNDISDKWDAVAPYKYHIAIENSACEDYWTEKLADTFLSEAYPFYFGCPNIDRYFLSDSFSTIDIKNCDEAIEKIEKAISTDLYSKTIEQRLAAKDLILDQYQLFPHICSLIEKIGPKNSLEEKKVITIYPEKKRKKNKIIAKIKSFLKI